MPASLPGLLSTLLLLLLCLPPVIVSLPLPQSIWPVSRFGDYWGNPWRADAVAEIEQLASRFLVDPPTVTNQSSGVTYAYPLTRTVLYVSQYGQVYQNGSNDWVTLSNAYQAACSTSQTLYQQYSQLAASNASLPMLPFGDDDNVLPVLVELRFGANVEYHISNRAGLATPDVCQYVLLNGQNSTFVTHWEAGYPLGYNPTTQQASSELFPSGYGTSDTVYLYNLNFRPSVYCSTYGQLVQAYRDGDGNLLGFDLAIQPNLLAFTSASTSQLTGGDGRLYMQHVDSAGQTENWELPVALYVGPDYGSDQYSSDNVTAVYGTQPEQLGGVVRFWIQFRGGTTLGGFPYNQMAEGQYWALFRGHGMLVSDHMRVYQGINTAGTGYFYGLQDSGDVIDCHQNRLPDSPFITWIEGPLAQLKFTSGTVRWWHSSIDGGVDDPLDINVQGANIIAVDVATNTVQLQAGSVTSYSSLFTPYDYTLGYGTPYEFGSYPDVLSPYALLHVNAILKHSTDPSYPWVNVSFIEPLPARVAVGDVIIQDNNYPDLLHVKNHNCGNHRDNCMDIKARSIVIEDSYFFNASYSALAITGDLFIYYEVGPTRNVTIRNNVFERTAVGVQTSFSTRFGAAHSNIYSLTVTSNIFYANYSDQYDIGLNAQVQLWGVANFNVSNNQFVTLSGPNIAARHILLCNANRGVLYNNSVVSLSQDTNRYGGQTCYPSTINPPAADCPDATRLPGGYELLDQSCMLNLTYDVYQSGNGWPQYTRFDQYHELRLDADIVYTGQPNYQPDAASALDSSHGVAYAPYVVDSTGFNWTHGAFDCSATPGSYLQMESPWNGLTLTADHVSLWQMPMAVDVWLNVLALGADNYFYLGNNNQQGGTWFISQHSDQYLTGWFTIAYYDNEYYHSQCAFPGYNTWVLVTMTWSGFDYAQTATAQSGTPHTPLASNATFAWYINGHLCQSFTVPQAYTPQTIGQGRIGPMDGYFGSVNVYKGTAATTEAAVSQRYQYTLQHGGQSAPHVQQYLVPDVSLSDSSTVQVAWASDAASLQAISVNPDLPTDTLQVECAVYAPSLYDVTGEGELFGAVQPAGALQLAFDGDASTAFSSDSPYAIVGLSFEQPAFIERVDLTPAPGSVQDMLGGSVYGGNSRRIDEDSTLLFTFDASLVDCYMDGTPLSTGLLGTGRSFRYVWYTASGGNKSRTSVAEMRVYARQWLATSTYQAEAVASYAANASATVGSVTFTNVTNATSADILCTITSLPVYEAWLPKYHFPASNRLLLAPNVSHATVVASSSIRLVASPVVFYCALLCLLLLL